ncbi:MAG: penicillin-binding protein 2 [Ruminococcus sp.]|nr:penicillin-binding protein 2 [Ruminococcus sp.]
MKDTRSRTLAFVLSAVMAALPFVGLYIAASAEYDEGNIISLSVPLSAKAGAVYDKNGRALSFVQQKHRISLVPMLFYSNEAVNSALLKLLQADPSFAERFTLPINEKGQAVGDDEELEILRSALGVSESEPQKLLSALYRVFGIDKSEENAYTLACIRYRALMSGEDMLVLSDPPSEELLEQAEILAQTEPFLRADSYYQREFTLTDGQVTAPHILKALEDEYSQRLSGTAGLDKKSYRLYQGGIAPRESSDLSPTDGEDITLTIDADLQLYTQSLLKDAIDSGKCTAGAICAVSCKSGEVLSIASAPDYDPARLTSDYEKLSKDERAPLFDRALWGAYRPGSAMKTITALAALDTKAIDSDTYLWCGKWYPLGDTVFSCLYYHGYESVQTALRDSCNVFFYKCSQLLGEEKLSEYQSFMGLGKSVNIGLENAKGRVVTPESVSELGIVWSEGLLLQSAIGQSETAVTPLQMAQWAQILANEGSLKPLSIIKGKAAKSERIIKNDHAFEQIREGMIMAADNIYGESSLYSLPHKAAIKTGTPETGSGYNSTVIGYYPADKPEIAFAIVLENSESAYTLVRPLLTEWEKER